ncbi:thermonuclease family protein [Leeia oryzae]|uniref:thermonuclease family protein n=1 Tax=Leeia oryzae TaxID=356662 RepID=UPI00037270DD|nr:thermonuclease family protein [Leeia oryzae]
MARSLVSKRMIKQVVLLLVALVSAAFGWQQHKTGSSTSYMARVVGVSDGDTITVLDDQQQSRKIRFAFIDAPEKKQAYGMRAKQALSDLVYLQSVKVDVQDTDRYGRTVAQIWLTPEGGAATDINLAQVKAGFAWHYIQYARKGQTTDAFDAYQAAERYARDNRLGLWQDASPVEPWLFRRTAK